MTEQSRNADAACALPQDKFGLRDVWEIVLGRKWLVIATTAICVELALAYVTLVTTVYESRAMWCRSARWPGNLWTTPCNWRAA